MKTFIDEHNATAELNLTETEGGVEILVFEDREVTRVNLDSTQALALAAALIEYAGA